MGRLLILSVALASICGWSCGVDQVLPYSNPIYFQERIQSAENLPQFLKDELVATAKILGVRQNNDWQTFVIAIESFLSSSSTTDDLVWAVEKLTTRCTEQSGIAKHFQSELAHYLPMPAYRGAVKETVAAYVVFVFSSLRANREYSNRFVDLELSYLSAEIEYPEWEALTQRLFGQITHR